jgi:hypothetical protein
MRNLQSEVLTRLIGSQLISLCRGDLLIDGEQNLDDLGPLELKFETGETLLLHLGPDGETIEFELSSVNSTELTVNGCTWIRIDLSKESNFGSLCGQKIVSIKAIYFGFDLGRDEVLAGLTFNFESESSLTYYNAGDFAKIYVNELPPVLPDPFYLKSVDVCIDIE